MLATLFGNGNVERILLFLFVNEKCYGTQIQTLLEVPLTPVQKALDKLARGGILISQFEGKTKFFRLNPDYPLRLELESLLQKAYTHLPCQEKKRYTFIHKKRLSLNEERTRDHSGRKALIEFWEKLAEVRTLQCIAKSRHELKLGKAEVKISTPTSNTTVFQEKGYWMLDELPHTAFSNSFCWTLDLDQSLVTLEHLRYGHDQPVFLFHLTPSGSHSLESVDSHLCKADTYLGNVNWNAQSIDFHWRIIGPRKNDELIYKYLS